MKPKLMPDNRQESLMKAAEACVGLMNVGVEPNAALTKVAKDFDMNDKEVQLVSHAVNNAKQIAHLQTSDPEKREDVFPLTNADQVVKDRYGAKDTETASANQADQPDAVGIKKELDKQAAASYVDDGVYFSKPTITVEDLRTAWGIKDVPTFSKMANAFPYATEQHVKLAVATAQTDVIAERDACARILQHLGNEFRKTAAPKFETFEKAALAEGVEPALLDMVYQTGRLDKFHEKRASAEEIKGRLYVPSAVIEMIKLVKEAEEHFVRAVNIQAAKDAMSDGFFKSAGPKDVAGGGTLGFDTKMEVKPLDFQEPLAKFPSEMLGLGEDPSKTVAQLFGVYQEEGDASPTLVPREVRQELKNIDARSAIEQLMQDDYIKGHSVPEVVEAYNQATSLNPSFSRAELISYIRQHLATKGAVPLDLQIRARPDMLKDLKEK